MISSMSESHLASRARAERRERESRLSLDRLSVRAQELAEQGIRDYAATHDLTYGEARRRLKAMARAGRQATSVADER